MAGVSPHADPPCGKWVEDYLNYAALLNSTLHNAMGENYFRRRILFLCEMYGQAPFSKRSALIAAVPH